MQRKEEEWSDLKRSLTLNLVLLEDGGNVTNEVSYKLSEKDASHTSSFIFEHEAYIQSLLDRSPQPYTEDIIDDLSKHEIERH